MSTTKTKLLFLTGCTAAGKSELIKSLVATHPGYVSVCEPVEEWYEIFDNPRLEDWEKQLKVMFNLAAYQRDQLWKALEQEPIPPVVVFERSLLCTIPFHRTLTGLLPNKMSTINKNILLEGYTKDLIEPWKPIFADAELIILKPFLHEMIRNIRMRGRRQEINKLESGYYNRLYWETYSSGSYYMEQARKLFRRVTILDGYDWQDSVILELMTDKCIPIENAKLN